jgi:AmiR/NasT family two-component response regulator
MDRVYLIYFFNIIDLGKTLDEFEKEIKNCKDSIKKAKELLMDRRDLLEKEGQRT